MIKKFSLFVLTLLFSFFFPLALHADILVIKVEGVVNPVMAEFISKNIDDAASANAEALVIELDTPGGLDTSMRSIVKKISSSAVPVVVYVSPGGARAASAGVFITISAHVAVMDPETNIGAAHPVGMGGKMDKTMADKAVNDAAAYIRSLAEKRKRNAEWAENAVRESVSITAEEALKLNVIDMTAPSMDSLLEKIDGREVETISGKKIIKTKDIKVVSIEPGFRHRVLNFISDPNVAYLLMLLGFYGIFFELTNPGSIFPGVLGAIALILAFYSFQTLPVNYAGILLILVGIVLFILEIKVTSYGMLTIGGIISMTIGSLMLIDSPLPFLRISYSVIVPSLLFTILLFILTMSLVIKAHRRQPATGAEELAGMEGEARTDIREGGQVFVHGEIWEAWSEEPIKAGSNVIVEKVKGLKLKVRRII
jgi:membrane-bound serine protease (ClpP class)